MIFGRILASTVAFIAMAVLCGSLSAKDLNRGYELESSGRIEDAAEFFCGYAKANPNDKKNTPEALIRCARTLDALADALTERAEKSCYWGKKGDPECMKRHVATYNAKFGQGSFEYEHAVLYIPYTGVHYKTLLAKFSNNKYVPEADFYLLLKSLVGHPDNVLPKIKTFLAKYKSGEWNRKGLLLWARVNEDIWYVHRKWSWVLFNQQIAPEELVVRAERYRQEALKTYQKLMKESKNTFEGISAAKEYGLLSASQDDGVTYSIVNDSSAGTLHSWGVEAPSARQTGIPPADNVPPSGAAEPSPAPSPRSTPRAPQRWEG